MKTSEQNGSRLVRSHRLALLALLSITCFIALLTPAHAQPQADSSTSSAPPVTYFDVRHDPDFNHYSSVLKKYARKHANHTNDDLCILGYAASDGTKSAWVIWPKGGKIFNWTGNNSPLDSPQTIDLKKDVVATDADVNGSTYLVTRAWVDSTKSACKQHGTKLHVSAD